MQTINGFTLYLWTGQFLVWLALLSALLRPLPVSRTARLIAATVILATPVWFGHNAIFYFAAWLGMASIPTLAVALYALAQDGKHPLSTRTWASLALVNAIILVPFLAWPVNGYEWGYHSTAGLLLLLGAGLTIKLKHSRWFWLTIATLLAWLAWPGISRNAFNYIADGMMLLAAPTVLLTRLLRTSARRARQLLNRQQPTPK
ncbi:hypothetical protein GCM10007392_30630 [Saccharospirillum salsuginis]|uniref:Uncharacterized protein n=2 Tax=Saccharospirillum salsuginis TaxID=418750 RepID=A0A918KGY0_9GAMM|nr:hypothetical protein GCM10007392_30630 [Saccharospirillum salsuginis]